MIIKGIARFNKGRKKHIITTQTEHKCVLDSCRKLSEEGFDITYLPVQTNGIVDLKELEAAIRPDTMLISIMAVNNETGVIQPLKEIGAIAKKHKGVYFHTDGAQAVGKIHIDVDEMNIDVMSISGHKIYGPKGVGAAYVRRRPRVRLEPIISGGGQERGLRSGTLPSTLVVGMGAACDIAKREMAVSVFSFPPPCCDEICTSGLCSRNGVDGTLRASRVSMSASAKIHRAGVLSVVVFPGHPYTLEVPS